MIDQARLDSISLHAVPLGQIVFGALVLTPNYLLPPHRTRIVLEGTEHLAAVRDDGGRGAILVMNHTDRFNYWPFQYALWRRKLGFTATWVKGKYYENPLVGAFLDAANNIPVPSRGYLITKDFQRATRRVPDAQEYRTLRRLADGQIDEAAARAEGGPAIGEFLLWPFPERDGAAGGTWADSVEVRFERMMRRVMDINRDALAKGLHVLIFPQGTRSKRLTRGHVGAAEVILDTGAPVVPIGCSGSDKLYPGNSPWSRGGTVTYRIGSPLTVAGELARFGIGEAFTPFTRSADKHHATFQALTDVLTDRINDLVDHEYRYGGGDSAAEGGAQRFV